jgi:hypothetical protein
VAEPVLSGGCLCGAVRFEIDAPLVEASYCHCTRCQRRSGTAASANARLAPGSLRVLQGAESVAEFVPPDGAVKCFCRECGAALWSRPRDGHEPAGVRLGAIDGDPGLRPAYHQYVAYAAPWEPLPDDGLPRYDEARPR